jgi:hypothetical protein
LESNCSFCVVGLGSVSRRAPVQQSVAFSSSDSRSVTPAR